MRIKERGNLVASLLVEADAPGARQYSTEVRVMKGIARVDLTTRIDKRAVREKEGVHIAFPFSNPGAQLRYDVADGCGDSAATGNDRHPRTLPLDQRARGCRKPACPQRSHHGRCSAQHCRKNAEACPARTVLLGKREENLRSHAVRSGKPGLSSRRNGESSNGCYRCSLSLR